MGLLSKSIKQYMDEQKIKSIKPTPKTQRSVQDTALSDSTQSQQKNTNASAKSVIEIAKNRSHRIFSKNRSRS